MCVPVLGSHPSNSTVVTAEGVSVHYAECSKDKLWFGLVGLMVCLAERSVMPVNGADLRFCRNHPVFPLFQ